MNADGFIDAGKLYDCSVAACNESARLSRVVARRQLLREIKCGHKFNCWNARCDCGMYNANYAMLSLSDLTLDDLCPLFTREDAIQAEIDFIKSADKCSSQETASRSLTVTPDRPMP